MSGRSKIWLASVLAVLVTFIVATLVLHQSLHLAVFTDVVETALLISGIASFIPLALRSRGRLRLFWSLIILGFVLWLVYQSFWVYYEVFLGSDVPDLFNGDIILFLNIVPAMAALALRPHAPRDEYASRLGRLDFALLLLWWLYVYILLVIPWQYVIPDIPAYNRNLNGAYLVEKLALLAGLAACWLRSKGQWKKLYFNLFGMSFCYSGSSALVNWAIARNAYYSGSLYDIPLACAMAWVTWIGLNTKAEFPESDTREVSTVYGVWVARLSMIAVFSLPLWAVWAVFDAHVPARVRTFRLVLTLFAAFCMGIMVFIRQTILDRELLRLLNHSRDSVDNLKRLQAQILQSEKLASIGQLVGGAAHELNNPITAMLGYSDLLLSTALTPEQKPLASKIGQYVRRTKSLVASLISFAKQAPAPKAPIDLNTLARTAIKLTEQQWEALEIEIDTRFDNQLPKVLGDSNQLLQVCLQVVANCLHLMAARGGRLLTFTTECQAGIATLHIAAGPMNSCPVGESGDDLDDNLALSACQGILQEHHGQIVREAQTDGSLLLLRVELPVASPVAEKSESSTSSVLWRSQPSV